jgi:hypothetical protein
MPVKAIVIPLETGYLQAEAKARGVSRTMLARLVMEKVIEDRLVARIVGDAPLTVPKQPRYRRFKD